MSRTLALMIRWSSWASVVIRFPDSARRSSNKSDLANVRRDSGPKPTAVFSGENDSLDILDTKLDVCKSPPFALHVVVIGIVFSLRRVEELEERPHMQFNRGQEQVVCPPKSLDALAHFVECPLPS